MKYQHQVNITLPIENEISLVRISLRPSFAGAWKVAYADFVTAMMAFFLLLWLLNVTTDEQKNAISNYFDPTPTQVSSTESGAGGVMGGLTMSPQGAMSSTMNPLVPQQQNRDRARGKDPKSKVSKAKEKAEEKRFKTAEEKIKQAIEKNSKLAELKKNLLIDMTPEGLRIQIVDQDNESMFPSGSAKMYDKTKELLLTITDIILEMPNELSVRGHTDATKYAEGAQYTNWELSADRANASRRVMMEGGVTIDRLNNVMGKADTEPLVAGNPNDPKNRRITIILLKEELTAPPEEPAAEETVEENNSENSAPETQDEEIDYPPQMPPIGTFRKTPGKVEFP